MFMLICSVIFNKFIVELIQSYTKIKLENIEKKVTTIIGTLVVTILILVWCYYLVKDKKDLENTIAYGKPLIFFFL